MREFAFANVPSSWLGRGGSRFGTRLRVTISLRVGAALAELDRGRDLDAGGFKNDMPPQCLELGAKSPRKKCKLSR